MSGEADVFDFGGALERMRAGKAVRRRAWPPGQKIALCPTGGRFALEVPPYGVGRWFPTDFDLLATDWETARGLPF